MTNSSELLLVDFDRTLFDTGRFVTAWWQWMAAEYDVNPSEEIGRIEEYFNFVGEWRNYDFYRHLHDLELPGTVDEVCARGRAALQGESFLFPDAAAVVGLKNERSIEIVTFGNQPYQSYKLSFCPELEGWSKHIIEVEKGDFIRDYYHERPTILVDDKMLAGTLPRTTRFIHLDRSQEEVLIPHNDYHSIKSLVSLKELL